MKINPYFLLVLCVAIILITACAPVFTRDINPEPASTAPIIPSISNPTDASAPCFLTYYDPVGFQPGTMNLFVRAGSGVQVYDLGNMHEVRFLIAATLLNESTVTLSPDGKLIAWALEGDAIPILRLSDRKRIATIHSRQGGPLKIEFSPLGDKLYSASRSGGVVAWDMNGQKVNEFQPAGELVNFGISPDGKTIATIPTDGPVMIWRADDFTPVTTLGGSGGYDTSDVAFSPDGKYLAADLATGLFMWNVSDGSELIGFEKPINSMAVAFAPDGESIAYADVNRVVISSPDGSQAIRTLDGHQSPVFRIVYSPDSSLLVSADDREIRVWKVESGDLLAIGKTTCP